MEEKRVNGNFERSQFYKCPRRAAFRRMGEDGGASGEGEGIVHDHVTLQVFVCTEETSCKVEKRKWMKEVDIVDPCDNLLCISSRSRLRHDW